VIKQFQLDQSFDREVMRNYLVDAFLLKDQNEHMGNHLPKKYHWDVAVKAKDFGRVILSGGLNPNNIVDAIRFLRPYGVDVCTGVEHKPGKLDKSLLRAFISNARNESLNDTEDMEYE
jgi:phosphoribosylanthranilate isomerase